MIDWFSSFPQYIFGEFSLDEINQFFVTPRCYVEVSNSSSVALSDHQEDYQHIEFGVDEVINSSPVGGNDPLYKVSSNLNPQAPEFILGCQSAQKAQGASPTPAEILDGADFNSLDGPDSDISALDNHQSCQDMDGLSGSLGQRERKKKKKRPPGYYNYLDPATGGSSAGAADGPLVTALVNGHALCGSHLNNKDVDTKASSGAGLSVPGPISSATGPSPSPANQRTCDKPLESTQSPRSKSPPPLPAAATPSVITSIASTESERSEVADCGVANGLVEVNTSVSEDELKDCQSGEQAQMDSSDLAVRPAVTEQANLQAAPAANPPKSWASLFHNSKPQPGSPQAFVEVKNVVEAVSPTVTLPEQPEKVGEIREGPVPVAEDPMAPKLAELIENVKLIHKPVSLQPRGLINKGNWCYINATLQALIACPPMYHLMKSIPLLNETQRPCTSTPMIDNFVRLVNEFNNMPVPSKVKQQTVGEKVVKDIRPGIPFEPTYIYRLLTLIKSSLSEKGRQEDAEEYLGFTLNGLHEEMLALKKLISPQEEKTPTLNGPESQAGIDEEDAEKEEEGSEDEWEQVGPRNKASITRQADFVRTPITDIFGGHIRSVVYQQNSKESATLQPFFTLQLDIQSEKIRTVQEALETLVARESVQGYTSKTKQEIEISRRVTLEELPPVLVLHLKRFVFEKTGGCQKLAKIIDYPVDLEISKDLFSSGVRSKVMKFQRTYRLFAVVYHHGNSATGGHYTTDVFHIGLNGWLRIDDQTVKIISQYNVVKQSAERTAYLLYYRRVDPL
uniref:Ubiquitin carboxyl-terminal hydrolase n=1 Tax=Gouania willdenowi TaxID=441366 RepID=A0A8C5HSV6_GOUWI